jgi:hypothetical protein
MQIPHSISRAAAKRLTRGFGMTERGTIAPDYAS